MGIDAKHPSEHAKKEKATDRHKKLTRRLFLGLSAASAAGVLSAAMGWNSGGDQGQQAAAADSSPAPTAAPIVAEIPAPPQPEILTFQGLQLSIDQNGIPTSYKFGDEEWSHFDEHVQSLLTDVRNSTMSEGGEPEVALAIKGENIPVVNYPTPEKPYVTELPEDVLTSAELAEYEIEVLNSEKEPTASHLFIRKGIFESILEPLALLKENLDVGESLRPLKIVVLNTEFLDAEAMASGTHLFTSMEETLRVLYDMFEDYREERISEIQAHIEELRSQIQNSADTAHYHELNRKLFDLKVTLSSFEEKDLYAVFTEFLYRYAPTQGVYYAAKGEDYFYRYGNPHYIFFAAPELAKSAELDSYSIGFDKLGKVLINRKYHFNERSSSGPRIDQNYPDPSTLRPRSEGSPYAYEYDEMGFVMYHEMAHHLLVSIFPALAQKGILKQSKLFQQMINDPEVKLAMDQLKIDTSGDSFIPLHTVDYEAFTDRVAKLVMKLAHDEYSQTGSDKKYPFVFQIPPDFYQPGGYQITESQRTLPVQQDLAA